MKHGWLKYFASIVEVRKGNLLEVSGSVLLIASLLLPWFSVSYRVERSVYSGLRLLVSLFSCGRTVSLMLSLTAVYISLLCLFILLSSPETRPWFLGFTGILLLGISCITFPLPVHSLGAGVYIAGAGLVLIAGRFFCKNR